MLSWRSSRWTAALTSPARAVRGAATPPHSGRAVCARYSLSDLPDPRRYASPLAGAARGCQHLREHAAPCGRRAGCQRTRVPSHWARQSPVVLLSEGGRNPIDGHAPRGSPPGHRRARSGGFTGHATARITSLPGKRAVLAKLPHARSHVQYSGPDATDRLGLDFDAAGRLTVAVLDRLGVPRDADFYLCGPPAFLEDFTAGLGDWGVSRDRVHTEAFGSGKPITPGVKNGVRPLPHAPAGTPGEGPSISFARAGLTVSWDSKFQSLLELAETCDVPVRWSCRTGVCHTCECGLISGSVTYDPRSGFRRTATYCLAARLWRPPD